MPHRHSQRARRPSKRGAKNTAPRKSLRLRRARWSKGRHVTMALLAPDSQEVQCRAGCLHEIQQASNCTSDKLPDPEISPTPKPGEPSDKRYKTLLRSGLHMSPLLIKSLADGFSHVAQVYKPSANVTQAQCAKLLTVAEAVVLVSKAAGF